MLRIIVHRYWQTLWVSAVVVGILMFVGLAPRRASASGAGHSSQSYERRAASATRAFKAGQFKAACKLYREASRLPSSREGKATVLYNLGSCLTELQQHGEAETAFRSAAKLSDEFRPTASLAAGFAALAQGKLGVAEADWLAVAHLDLDYADALRAEELAQRLADERVRRARQALATRERAAAREHLEVAQAFGTEIASLEALAAELDSAALDANGSGRSQRKAGTPPVAIVLPEPGLAGWAGASGGYDSNANQTASSNRQGEALELPVESGTATAFLSAEYTFRTSEKTRVSVYYSGMYLGVTASALQNADLSIHEAGVGLRLLLTPTVRASATVGTTAVFEGFTSFFSYETLARVALDKQLAPGTTLGSLVEWKEVRGTPGRDYSTGHRARVQVSGRVALGRASFGLRVDGRFNRVGALYLPADLVEYGVCPTGVCAPGTLVVPFSYDELRGVASVRFALREDLAASADLEVAGREYSQDGGLLGVAGGLKQRHDRRTQLGASVEYVLDEAQVWAATVNYGYTVNVSNMKPDPTSASHRFDFSDRNYAQHIVELGVEFVF